jgi:drug/metabolite transporter (DMT)-like permease
MPFPVLLLLIGINLLWAGSSLAAKIALHSISPMTLAFVRFSLAALLMYGIAVLRRVDLRVARRDWGRFWVMGILGLALTYLLSYAGIQRTTASESALIIAAEPVFLGILAYFFLREKLYPMKVAGIVAGLIGAYLIVAHGWHLPVISGLVIGDLLIALGLVFEAGASILGKGLVARYPAITVMTYQMTSGAIALAPFAAWELISTNHPMVLPPPAALWSLLYLVIPCTVFAYTVWFTVLDKREAGEMSVFLFVQPVAGAFLGAYFLGDKITGSTVAGALLVLLGVALINRRPDLPRTPPAPPVA